MAYASDLEIAQTRFAIRSGVPFDPAHFFPLYRPFMTRASRPDASALVHRMRLRTDPSPSLDGLKQTFDGGSWSMRTGRGYRWMVAHAAARPAEPFWVARLQAEFARSVVWCGPPLVRRSAAGLVRVRSPFYYPLDQLLTLYLLSRHSGVLVHAAGVVIGDRGLLLAGRSGAGKSTLSRLLLECGAGRVLSDDRIVLRRAGGGWFLFGTPWAGEAGIAENRRGPLSAILFPVHGRRNRIESISVSAALERLLPVASVPWYDREVMADVLSSLESLASSVPAYVFRFTPDSVASDRLKALAEELD